MGRNLWNFFLFWLPRCGVAIGFMLLFAHSGQAQVNSLGDAPFQSYYITGGHASAGVRMRGLGQGGLATADISVSIPEDADILAAFLYWETLEKTTDESSALGYLLDPCSTPIVVNRPAGCSNDGSLQYPLTDSPGVSYLNPIPFYGKPLGQNHTAPCWSNGGSTGSSQGAPSLRVYRADILRYLRIRHDTSHKVPAIRVQLPDSGSNGGGAPLTEGASLLIIYRQHGANTQVIPLRQIFVFDGSATMNQENDSLFQTLPYYRTTGTPNPKLTYIIGDGQSFSERLWFDTDPSQLAPPASFIDSPFAGPYWDNQTFNVSVPPTTNLTPPTEQFYKFYTKVDHGSGSFDCLSLAAIVFSLELLDQDQDGLAYDWENFGYKNIWATPPTMFFDLRAMVPSSVTNPDFNHKDVYIEIDRMRDWANHGVADGVGSPHEHKVKKDAIDMVGAAVLKAGVYAHFDVGTGDDGAGKFYQPQPQNEAQDPYIIPAAYSQGGDVWNERRSATYCTQTIANDPTCVFPNQPGVTLWKIGLESIKGWLVPADPHLLPSDTGYAPLVPNKLYFENGSRGPIFRYMMFIHALGVQVLDPDPMSPTFGQPIPGPSVDANNNPVSNRGKLAGSISGKAELPGADSVIAMGNWSGTGAEANVGSKELQAATMLHELGHTWWGYHGGERLEPNCKVTQISTLNHLYQTAGVLDALGGFNISLSGAVPPDAPPPSAPPTEISLVEANGVSLNPTAYRLRWYAPAAAAESFLQLPLGTITPAKRHCDGTLLSVYPSGGYSGNPDNVVRVDGYGYQGNALAGQPVDWNYDGDTNDAPNLDINFNGTKLDDASKFQPKSDWGHIFTYQGLQQLGTRRSLYGLSAGVTAGDLLLDNEALPAQHDPLTPQVLGESAVGESAVGESAVGESAVGESAVGESAVGESAVGESAVGESAVGDVDERSALAVGIAPYALTGQRTPASLVQLNWVRPPAGAATSHVVYRLTVTAKGNTKPKSFPPIQAPTTTFLDTSAKANESYLYYVIAKFSAQNLSSSPSNFFLSPATQ